MIYRLLGRPQAVPPPPGPSFAASVILYLFNRRVFSLSRYVFSIFAVAVFGAKLVHIYAHVDAMASDLLGYGMSFFAQDVLFLVMMRLLLDNISSLNIRCLRILAISLSSILVASTLFFASVSISFFVVTGTELRWRNVGVASDSAAWGMLLSGLFSCSVVGASILLVAWLAQDLVANVFGAILNLVRWPFSLALSKIAPRAPSLPLAYQHIPQDDVEDASGERKLLAVDDAQQVPVSADDESQKRPSLCLHVSLAITLIIIAISTIARPVDSSLIFMSWTLPLVPFIDLLPSSPSVAGLVPSYGNDVNSDLENRTALAEPPSWTWLPEGETLPGFEDWYEGKDHYRADKDPLRVSNLNSALLPELRHSLSDVKIRHVVLIKLESTRKDVFPIKKGGYIWETLAASHDNNTLPSSAVDLFSKLTPNANYLTGDFDDGFAHAKTKPRGGINANNVHTTSTYTLKSLAGTLCGLYPLVADFNREYETHVYQPCLSHIFNAFNALEKDQDDGGSSDDFSSFKWRSTFMQSVTDGYDKQNAEMPVLGYPEGFFLSKEILQSGEGKFGKINVSDINYYGMSEEVLKDYVREEFAAAKKDNGRVFLSHLTSTTHHPFVLPEGENYLPLTDDKKLNDLSHYVNTIGFADQWLGQILEVLEEEGVADETLVVLVGDHGLSLPENGGVTPYYNGNVGNFHVPLVLSHPSLPAIDVNDAAASLSILPTILDLLVETGSLSKTTKQAAQDLMKNYEGQSLLRPQRQASWETGESNWLFTVMNPGRATVAIRDAHRPDWRLIMPVIDDVEWRFTNTAEDPHEMEPVISFSFAPLLEKIERKHGVEAATWAETAAFKAQWWVKENNKRWRFDAK
ncbi:hypothetical protein XA68_18483 [Ophiocordyceps unilateralis]|uniref:Sulfatase N-terminal domain-containing protein n=1 Tax=Ophiocordyceps unilateralis TaxID=268505 RepID=A0A2A9P304_OPHUN|nr:hypothetical protein XA68_18483 [Ophiocordyceps unilateralis]